MQGSGPDSTKLKTQRNNSRFKMKPKIFCSFVAMQENVSRTWHHNLRASRNSGFIFWIPRKQTLIIIPVSPLLERDTSTLILRAGNHHLYSLPLFHVFYCIFFFPLPSPFFIISFIYMDHADSGKFSIIYTSSHSHISLPRTVQVELKSENRFLSSTCSRILRVFIMSCVLQEMTLVLFVMSMTPQGEGHKIQTETKVW